MFPVFLIIKILNNNIDGLICFRILFDSLVVTNLFVAFLFLMTSFTLYLVLELVGFKAWNIKFVSGILVIDLLQNNILSSLFIFRIFLVSLTLIILFIVFLFLNYLSLSAVLKLNDCKAWNLKFVTQKSI